MDIQYQTKYLSRNPVAILLNRTLMKSIGICVESTGPKTVLDVGCGEGVIVRTLSGRLAGLNIDGLDVHGQSLAIARAFNPGLCFVQGSVYHLPVRDNAYDLVLCTEVLEHLERPEAALRELVRVSRKHILLTVPREPLWRMANMVRGKYWGSWGNTPSHIQHWTPGAFRSLVEGHVRVVAMKVPLMWTMLLCEVEAGR